MPSILSPFRAKAARQMAAFSVSGRSGPPRWSEGRRCLLRCELDAAFFHLYLGSVEEWRELGSKGEPSPSVPYSLTPSPLPVSPLLAAFPTPRAAVAYIMDTFPIVKRKDEAEFNGDYRTKRFILESTTPSPSPCKPARCIRPASTTRRQIRAAVIRQ
ncbi:MAG: hypothetical protein O2960_06175 [Verrucomicrobia bacterium]|nr:hypothetical protein [Verrucomicrobiota bacterium]